MVAVDLTSITPSPAALKALAHPVRLRMLGLLRIEGPATATTLATRLGLNTGATSYHLRQLAQHGFVVEDDASAATAATAGGGRAPVDQHRPRGAAGRRRAARSSTPTCSRSR